MTTTVGREAAIPNPKLAAFSRLVGTWSTVGKHPMVPGVVLHGRTSFEWLEGGAFLMMRSEIDEPRFPSGMAIIGSDDAAGQLSMLYFDERGVSRRYELTMQDMVMTWWRDAPDLSQRFICRLAEDGQTMVGEGLMSRDGGAWTKDLDLTYTRARS
jgi:hypothetical protein